MIILVLILLIPAAMIESLIQERKSRKQEVISEIGAKWGQKQTLTGPIISIPYKNYYKDTNNDVSYSIKYAHFLPDSLNISGKMTPEIRYRGIYETVLYNARLELTGSFSYPQIDQLNIKSEDFIWSGTIISIGISDMRGITEQIDAKFNGNPISMNPGLETNDIYSYGVSAKIALPNQNDNYSFNYVINLNGSHQMDFIPVGKLTDVLITSDWTDPSFTGGYLPSTRIIDNNGFSANWKIFDLNRNYPQCWIGNSHNIDNSAFGVELFIPVDIYQKSIRTVKYALMFIVLTFIAFFFSEVMNRLKVHPIQYLLIGLAISIFYTLLISISEHTTFNFAYILSSLAVITLITGYAKSILKNNRMSAMVGSVLVILYGYLFIILQLEDYALLMGSIGLFIVLSLVMYITRKIDWYAIRFDK